MSTFNPSKVQMCPTTDYANTGGTGDRRAFISFLSNVSFNNKPGTALIDGSWPYGYGNLWWSAGATSGKYITFLFRTPQLITEVVFRQENTATHGTWKWQGSNDGITWTDVGTTFTLGGAATQTITTMSANVTLYKGYRLLGTAGNMSDSPYIGEFEFKIAAPNGFFYGY